MCTVLIHWSLSQLLPKKSRYKLSIAIREKHYLWVTAQSKSSITSFMIIISHAAVKIMLMDSFSITENEILRGKGLNNLNSTT